MDTNAHGDADADHAADWNPQADRERPADTYRVPHTGVADATRSVEDKRVQRRRRTLRAAKVVLSDWTAIGCLVRDRSDAGARLSFETVTRLPPTFGVFFDDETLLHPAELRWSRGTEVGIRLVGEPRATARIVRPRGASHAHRR